MAWSSEFCAVAVIFEADGTGKMKATDVSESPCSFTVVGAVTVI